MVHRFIGWLSAAIVASIATAAMANSVPATRLVSCGAESCLLVAGHRPDAASPVWINGHAVTVEGGRSWRVRLPLAQVRAWSLPAARTLAVTIAQPDGHQEIMAEAGLPVGVLGHVTKLAALVVTIR